MLKTATALVLAVTAAQNLGPGNGPWEVVSPESQGLRSADLEAADRAVDSQLSDRVCYVVAKNGKIVYERYMRGGTQSGIRAGWSTTKSMCASLFGIAVQQGFLNVRDPVTLAADTRLCNRAATFENVLTMTGQSVFINNPRYNYDTLGTNCLNTIQDVIRDFNPDSLSTSAWMRRYWYNVLGMEHMTWGPAAGNLGCGFGAQVSCRDLLRAGQLWANNGLWQGVGQVMDDSFARVGVTPVFPNSGEQYGYTLYLEPNDPVDNRRGEMNGLNAQCVFPSARHNAVIVTMGNGGSCKAAWAASRAAIVSGDDPLYNATRNLPGPTAAEQAAQEAIEEAAFKEEILSMAEMMQQYADQFLPEDLAQYNKWLVYFGGKAIVSGNYTASSQ